MHVTDTSKSQAYSYDDIGNRKQRQQGSFSPTVVNYTANALNQYSAITGASRPGTTPVHDAEGNLLSGATGSAAGKSFVWDAENRVVAVKDAVTGQVE